MTTIRDRLTEVRDTMGLSDFADAVIAAGYDTDRESVRRYEKGRKVPAEYVAAVCRAFNYRLDWLVNGEEPKRPIPLSAEVAGFRQIAAIVDSIRLGADAGAAALPGDGPGGDGERDVG